MCGSFVEYVERVHKEEISFDPLTAKDRLAATFECLGNKILEIFDKLEQAASGTPTPEQELELVLHTLGKIISFNRAERWFYDVIEEIYPEDDGGEKRRQMKDELLKLLLRRVLDNEPASKRSLGALRSLLTSKHRK
uniref:Developmentally-regulated tft1 n=1 Tax=Haliotis asinina TaxID=109174 RepID=Q5D220_HALAI|nr:developmentally-regulated tft1 [Haliotis asinina]